MWLLSIIGHVILYSIAHFVISLIVLAVVVGVIYFL